MERVDKAEGHVRHHTKVGAGRAAQGPLPVYFQGAQGAHGAAGAAGGRGLRMPRYVEFAKTFGFAAMGACLVLYVVDQRERVDDLERHLAVQRKTQKDLVAQMQAYKRKTQAMQVAAAKRDTLVQGRLQTHVALLREQLEGAGVEPVSTERACEAFVEHVRVTSTPNSVDLWVPSTSELKGVFPDAGEYRR